MKTPWWILAIALAVPMSAVAQEEEAAPEAEGEESQEKAKGPQKPGDKLVAMFAEAAGAYRCTATVTERLAGSTEVPATAKIAPVLDGFAYALEYATAAKNQPSTRMMVVWSQDPLSGKLTESGWDSQGGSWRGTSVGVRDGKLVWAQDGSAQGDVLRMRTTWIKVSARELQRMVEVRGEDGRWQRTIEETCKR